jgi:hypothetical protein
LRQGEKALSLCRHAWRVVHRLYPTLFDPKVPYPWDGTTKKRGALDRRPRWRDGRIPAPTTHHNWIGSVRAIHHNGSALRAAPVPGLAAFRPRPNSAANTILGRALLKRKVYFAFDFDDLTRTNNVRQAWKIHHPGSAQNRSFYDRSIWQSRNITNEDALKALMRGAIKYSSAVCVLVGTGAVDGRSTRSAVPLSTSAGFWLFTSTASIISNGERQTRLGSIH